MNAWKLILVGACVFLGASGCKRPETGRTTLQFAFWGSIEQQQAENEIIRRFEAAYPDIRIEPMRIGARYQEKLQAMLVGDIAPDVFMVPINLFPDLAARDALLDVTDEVAAIAAKGEIMPVPRQAFRYRGRDYGIPITVHALTLYTNFDALRAAGVTVPPEGPSWEWLEAIAPRFAGRAGRRDAPTDYLMVMPALTLVVWGFGGDFFDDPFKPTRVMVNSPQTEAAFDYLRRLHATGAVLPFSYFSDRSNPQSAIQLFRDGKVAFHTSGRWDTPNLRDRTNFTWDVLPIPSGPGGRISEHGGTALVISRRTRHPEAAKEFCRFYSSPAVADIFIEGGRYVPILRQVAYSPEFLAQRPPASIVEFTRTMEAGASRQIVYVPGHSELSVLIDDTLGRLTTPNNLTTKQIVGILEAELNRWLERQQRKGLL